jgi:hypothetical protein
MTRIAFTEKEAALFRLTTDPAATDGERSAAAEALGRLLLAPLYSTLLIGKMFWSWAGSWHTTTAAA